jgi:predicted acyltransferase
LGQFIDKKLSLVGVAGGELLDLASQGAIFQPINASLAYAICFILFWLFLMWLLYRKGIYIKV